MSSAGRSLVVVFLATACGDNLDGLRGRIGKAKRIFAVRLRGDAGGGGLAEVVFG
jgi:hypothetical protein